MCACGVHVHGCGACVLTCVVCARVHEHAWVCAWMCMCACTWVCVHVHRCVHVVCVCVSSGLIYLPLPHSSLSSHPSHPSEPTLPSAWRSLLSPHHVHSHRAFSGWPPDHPLPAPPAPWVLTFLRCHHGTCSCLTLPAGGPGSGRDSATYQLSDLDPVT